MPDAVAAAANSEPVVMTAGASTLVLQFCEGIDLERQQELASARADACGLSAAVFQSGNDFGGGVPDTFGAAGAAESQPFGYWVVVCAYVAVFT